MPKTLRNSQKNPPFFADTLPALVVGGTVEGQWLNVRKTTHWQNNGFVGDVKSEGIRCDQLAGSTATTMSVAAGSTVGLTVSPNIYHPGPVQFYLAKVPDGQTAASWDGSGEVWFKIYGEQPVFGGQQLTWASTNKAEITVTIPKCIPSGEYLLRGEHIALHSASAAGGAQFYLSCAQISVTGGGSTEGTPKVAFPGAYSAQDPGIMININYPVPTSYKNPGPPVFSC